MRDVGADVVEAEEGAQDAWVDHVRDAAEATLFPKANSWYLGANIPGKKRVFMPYTGGFKPYADRCEEVAAGGYTGFRFSAAGADSDAALAPTR
jgi:cyclohexanone monooxygenase